MNIKYKIYNGFKADTIDYISDDTMGTLALPPK